MWSSMANAAGTIGVLSSELSRYTDFSISLTQTCLHEMARGRPVRVSWTKGTDVVGNMNTMTRNMQGEWLWVLGDDHVFEPSLLMRLLDRHVDVIVPHVLKRTAPFAPVVFTDQNEMGEYRTHLDLPEDGLVEVYAAGSAGMLIRREVLDALDDPVFESHGGLNEDLTFCAKVRDAGFKIWIDVGALMGHIGEFVVWPSLRHGEWQMELDVGNGVQVPLQRFAREEALAR